MQRNDLELFADYNQFYVQDELASGDLSSAWSGEAVSRLLAVAPGVVGVGTASNTDVPVTVEIHEAAPQDDSAAFDQVNECTLVVAHGPLVIAGCTDYFPTATRIQAKPGTYRVRVSYLGVSGVPGSEERYRLQLWPAPAIEPTVVKSRAA
ncbi:hypothetical protein [Dyella sp. A6]|uniref:hypothetical protein n=1 Tax=Dyella aluminiiresistens TaxID=3069105 RepID=UPI002E77537F|nr:hypothetical protein [Dyella sp. A6]